MLRIHVIGCGFGESVVVQLPSGKAGVIDCFSFRPNRPPTAPETGNPTLDLLRDLGVKSLAFVALTHPHEDHGRGLRQIFDAYQDMIEQFWIFPSFNYVALRDYMIFLKRNGHRSTVEEALNEPQAGLFAREFSRVRNTILEHRRDRTAQVEFLLGDARLAVPGEAEVTIRVLGPTAKTVIDYENRLSVLVKDAFLDDRQEQPNPDWKPSSVNHNEISAALYFEYDRVGIVLGGDMEQMAWERVLDRIAARASHHDPATRGDFAFRAYKISHHGSRGSLSERFFLKGDAVGPRVGVVTPYNRLREPLPRKDVIEALGAHLDTIFVTCRDTKDEATRALFDIPPASPKLDPYFGVLSEQPQLAGELNPRYFKDKKPPARFVSEAMIEQVEEDPSIADAIHQALRGDRQNLYRISLAFDPTRGELESERHVGPGAGIYSSSERVRPGAAGRTAP